jgi:hypothetical protein
LIAEVARRSLSGFRWQILGFLLAVTASTYPIFVHMDDGSLRLGGYMPWWSVMDSLQRITFIPHLLAGQALLAFMLFAGSSVETIRRLGNWFFLGVLGFVLGIIFPPGFIFVIATFCVMIGVEFVYDKKLVTRKKFLSWVLTHIVPRAIICIIAAPSLAYLQLMVTFFPWKQLALADILHPLPFKYPEYLQAVGIMLPLGVVGLAIAFRKKERSMILSISWVITWALLLVIFNFIPQQSPLRFSEMIVHVPLGILAAYLFYILTQKIVNSRWGNTFFADAKQPQPSFSKKPHSLPNEISHMILNIIVKGYTGRNFSAAQNAYPRAIIGLVCILFIPITLIILNLAHMYSSWFWQRDFVIHKITAMYPLVPTGSYVMYPLNDFIDAIRWIQDHSPRDSVILSETTAGNYIPVYAGNYVYAGHENTVNSDEKKLFIRAFFGGTMPANDAYTWLKQENFAYIFFGPQEREDAYGKDLNELFPFLEQVYKNDNVTLYKLK